jgi:outer membrane receptor protein involved in Fe transport
MFSVFAFSGHAALAAEEAAATSSSPKIAEVEEVVVTGTRVVRDGYQAPTPLTVVGEEQLNQSGTTNVADYVNTIPSFAGSTSPATTQSSMSGGSSGRNSINLRNLGLTRTLVLLDGKRSVGSNSDGVTDVNTFPQNLINRVDVVTGGASAAYGSDALAGVVNFVLDKKFSGVKGEISGGVTTYGDDRSYDVNVAAGTGFHDGRGHFLFSAQTTHEDGVQVNDRPWNLQGWEIITNPAYGTGPGQSRSVPERLLRNHVGVQVGIAGGIVPSGPLKGTAFGPGGVPYQFVYGDLVSGSVMTNGQWQSSTIRGTKLANGLTSRDTTQNIFTRGSYEITDDFEVYAQASWAHDYNHNWCCAAENNGDLRISIDNPFIPASVRTRMIQNNLTVLPIGTMNADLPTAGATNDRRVQRYVVGGNGSFNAFETLWTWDAYAQVGLTLAHEQVTDPPRRSRYNKALDAVTGSNGLPVCRVNADASTTNDDPACVPYNVFGIGVNSQAAINYVMGYPGVDLRNERFVQKVFAASAQGEPVSTWAGPVSLAFGIEHRDESAAGRVDDIGATGDWLYGNYRPLNASSNVTEGFIQTVVPLAKDMTFVKSFDVDIGYRGTSYSTSGFVSTYKFSGTYQPIDDIRFRVTRSRDIRAPNLIELYSGGSGGFPGYLNPFKLDANGQPTSEIGISSTTGNATLKPEKSDNTIVGAVVTPSFLPGFSASVDYWNYSINGAIGNLTTQQIIDQCFAGNQQTCAALTFAPDKTITLINIRPFNLVKQIVRGIDIESSYRIPMDALVSTLPGDLTARVLATHYIKSYSSNGINKPTDVAGVNANVTNAVPDWRWNASLSYTTDTYGVNLTARGVSAGKYLNSNIECTSGCPISTSDNRTIDNNRIPGAVFFDVALSYKFGIGDATAAEAFFNVRNIANKDPAVAAPGPGGFTYEAAPANAALYDVLGRVFKAGIRFKM